MHLSLAHEACSIPFRGLGNSLSGTYCHTTSSTAFSSILSSGALLPADVQTAPSDGESLANPTCHSFVSFEDGTHPWTVVTQLFRMIRLSDPRLAKQWGSWTEWSWCEAMIQSIPNAHFQDIYMKASESGLFFPNADRALQLFEAAATLMTERKNSQWIDRVLHHLVYGDPYTLFPSDRSGFIGRLIHDWLLMLNYHPGAVINASGIDCARARLRNHNQLFFQRLYKIARRQLPIIDVIQNGLRYGMILVFQGVGLDQMMIRAGDRELRCYRRGGVPLSFIQSIYVPQPHIEPTRRLATGIPVFPVETLVNQAAPKVWGFHQ